jgi:chromosome segregation protein
VQLRRLELMGFKTFVARTELEFHPGITAIVGPNGSGKSNIFDAIRWALGETNARLLRGGRMDDLIFAGSAGRKPHAMAQVSLTLDNGAGLLPLEFSEITVTRAVTRGGEGRYAINGIDCRLRDVQMLFLGTGLGGRSYALVGQGEVDAVLRATPVERRQWLEEAAGLARYKRQRVEAERRLGHAQAHLERLADLVAALESQQQALAAQAEAAARHQRLIDDIRELDLALFADEARRLLAAARRLTAQLAAERDAREAAAQRHAAAAAAVADADAALAAATAAVEREQAALLEGAEQVTRLAMDAQLLAAEADALRARCEHLAEEQARLAQTLDRLRAEEAALAQEAAAGQDERARLAAAVADAEAALAAARDALAAQQAMAGAVRDDAAEVARTLAQARRDLAAAQARAAVLQQSAEAAAHKARAAREAAQRAAADRAAAEEALAEARTAAAAAAADVAAATAALDAQRGQWAALIEQVHEVELEEHRLRARLASIEEAHRQRAGLDDGARAVLLAARDDPARFPGLRGAVAELLDAPEALRPAITAVLGRRLHCLVVERREQLEPLLGVLAADGARAATMVALEDLRPPRAHAPDAPGGLRADRAVQPACGDEALARRLAHALLGDAVIVDDLAAAWALRAAGFEGRAVTRDGLVLEPDGVLSVGGWSAGDLAPLGRGQTIATMRQALEEIERTRLALVVQRAAAAERVRDAEAALARARAAAEAAQAAVFERSQQVERLAAEVARLTAEARALEDEGGPRDDERAHLARQVETLDADVRRLEEEARRLEAAQAACHAELARVTAAHDAAAAALQAARLRLAEAEGRVQMVQARAADRRASAADLTRRMAELDAARRAAADAAAEVEHRRRAAAAAYDALLARQAAAKAELERLQAERGALRQALAARQDEHRAAGEALTAADAAVHRTEVRAAQVEAELEAARGRLAAEFGVTLEDAAARRLQGSREEAQRQLTALREALRELGPVNLRAAEEHAAVRARLDALRAQVDDLDRAAALLREVIGQINAALHVRFRQTFEDVNAEFGRLFQRLFGGGGGYLELVEAEDGNEPGLEVIAQLPGKMRRPLVALSGGERVLVALALIFAMLRVHPSPFCIFDEVEAALDDANTQRFVTLLRDLAERTQVLIITHNKGTMTAADVLYGVTMQEPGVSSLVSVRLVPPDGNGQAAPAGTAAPVREPVAAPGD